jgi:hypothetical protein
MSNDADLLDEANACHDAEPARAAELMRRIDTARLPAERRPSFAFLLNHVLGEKLAAWQEAVATLTQLVALAQPAPLLVLWRQLGSAALAADAEEPLALATDGLAAATGASMARVRELLALSAATYLAPSRSAADAAQIGLQALAGISQDGWPTGTALDAQAAACASNLANGLLDRPQADLRHGALRAALSRSAELAHRLWLHAGTWVHRERALYTQAVACTTLGEPHLARRHAIDGLAVLDAHDGACSEGVDRAFLELERWNACAWLGLTQEAESALASAEALAAGFNEAGLIDWFESRRRRLPGFRR